MKLVRILKLSLLRKVRVFCQVHLILARISNQSWLQSYKQKNVNNLVWFSCLLSVDLFR